MYARNIIPLPTNFTSRDYQKDAFDAFFKKDYKRLILVWHRRAGKDTTCLNMVLLKAIQRTGNYYYVFPELKQARRDIWNAINSDGKRFLDYIPKGVVRKINNSDMRIELINGSILEFVGSDRYDSLMGSNPVGIIMSEYSLQNPMAWELLRPILAENGGWCIFQFTPRGTNHAFDLYNAAINNDKWFVQKVTVLSSKRHNGLPVITEEILTEERATGMDEDLIQQEYFCSFEAAVKGAYFSRGLQRAEDEGRVTHFAIDNSMPVTTYWDIGYNDATAIWFVQHYRNEIRLIKYFEFRFEQPSFFVNELNMFRDKHRIAYGTHWAPHDVVQRRHGMPKTLVEIYLQLGIRLSVVPRIPKKSNAVQAAQRIFHRCYFHRENCDHGLRCLRQYHANYSEKLDYYGNPVHDWSSHGADAFMAIAQVNDPAINKDKYQGVIKAKPFKIL